MGTRLISCRVTNLSFVSSEANVPVLPGVSAHVENTGGRCHVLTVCVPFSSDRKVHQPKYPELIVVNFRYFRYVV